MSRILAVAAVLFLIQAAFAADPNQGATVLQPSGVSSPNKGVTVLTTNGQPPVGACAVGQSGCNKTKEHFHDPDAPIAPPPPGYKVAVVIHQKSSACECPKEELNCACAPKVEFVQPELKPVPKRCKCDDLTTPCPCEAFEHFEHEHARRFGHHRHGEHSESSEHSEHSEHSWVHETVAPEQAPRHVKPEVREKLRKIFDCAKGDPCAPQPEYTQPELKPECSCAPQVTDCACHALMSN